MDLAKVTSGRIEVVVLVEPAVVQASLLPLWAVACAHSVVAMVSAPAGKAGMTGFLNSVI
jgi:hypothetical protein